MIFDPPLVRATLVQRYKRFLFDAVLEDGTPITGSCPNTGSMRGLTTPGSTIWMSLHDSPTRKYRHMFEMVEADGTLVGVNCGYFSGKLDSLVMRISDVCLAFPGLVFALAIAAVLNGGVQNAVIALAVISWPKYSRIARSQTLAVKHTDFIAAARLAGSTPFKIITKHILPNIIGPILVTAMLDIGTMLMEIAALSFLGLGAKPPVAEWGSMMSGGRSMLQTYPWVVLSPGIAIFVSVVLFNLLGDTVRDYVDPRNSRIK